MKNHNVYEFTGNIESSIKNGDIRQIFLFPGISNSLLKLINSFENKKEIEASEDFPYQQTLIKFRSPFRIGEQQLRVINPNNIFSRDFFDKKEFRVFIQKACKRFKNSINVMPINGNLSQFRKDIIGILEENVRDTKVVILN
jgi:hypothetical protein